MSDEKEAKNLVDPSALSIVSSGKKTPQPKEDFETVFQDAGTGITTSEIYDQFMKLIYVIDNSGSMRDGMALSDNVNRYEWDDQNLVAARKAMEKYLKEEKEEDEEEFGEALFSTIPVDDEELKKLIVENSLVDSLELEIPLKRFGGFGASKSKIETVKEAAKSFVKQRYEKYSDANVMLFGFDSEAYVLGRGINETEVLTSIDKLDAQGGDTRIVSAVKTAIGECRKRPSEVGAHHIVLVTDGYDNHDGMMTDLLPQLTEMHIVLDFIFVKGQTGDNESALYKAKIDAIKEVCEKTHGEYTEVGTVEDFTKKFLAVSNRPMLPWR